MESVWAKHELRARLDQGLEKCAVAVLRQRIEELKEFFFQNMKPDVEGLLKSALFEVLLLIPDTYLF